MSMKLSHYLIFKRTIRSYFGGRNLSDVVISLFGLEYFTGIKISSQDIRDLKSQKVHYD